jgi:hypothetical protein
MGEPDIDRSTKVEYKVQRLAVRKLRFFRHFCARGSFPAVRTNKIKRYIMKANPVAAWQQATQQK